MKRIYLPMLLTLATFMFSGVSSMFSQTCVGQLAMKATATKNRVPYRCPAMEQLDLQSLQERAKSGDGEAKYELYTRYISGDGIKKDKLKAKQMLNECARDQRTPRCGLLLGDLSKQYDSIDLYRIASESPDTVIGSFASDRSHYRATHNGAASFLNGFATVVGNATNTTP